jgi:S1-C subfamily serine protease
MHNNLLECKTPTQLALHLGMPYGKLAAMLYGVAGSERYVRFEIPKKNGQTRLIQAPNRRLKAIQRQLAVELAAIYSAPSSAHGFVRDRSIITNAGEHLDKRFVFNIDLEDFFGSISSGRVMRLFMSGQFGFDKATAGVLAQICCVDRRLPQGAPTSPIVSNMIARKMDRQLEALARKHRCTYTRYVDDISFSFTSRWPRLPHEILVTGRDTVEVGDDLARIIRAHGFRVNPEKVRLAGQSARMAVTGITVNVRPNVSRRLVRQVSAMLHAWDEHTLEAAQSEFHGRWSQGHSRTGTPKDHEEVVHGKLTFMRSVKGDGDRVFNRLAQRFNELTTRDCLRFPIVTRVTDPQSAESALWVIENDGQTGTGFLLEGIGLVTCAHVVGDIVAGQLYAQQRAFKHDNVELPYRIVSVVWDTERELAVCHTEVEPEDMPGGALTRSALPVRRDLPVTVLGFPNYGRGHEPYVVGARVTRRIQLLGRSMLEINEAVRPGLSGGPIVDSRGSLVAVVDKHIARDPEGDLLGGNYAVEACELDAMLSSSFEEAGSVSGTKSFIARPGDRR